MGRELEEKWQNKWEERKFYEPKAGEGKKFYLTAAFPYPNSPQHIGHARTYTTTDIYARYKRLRGRNVLFPMAFHVTGTPILGMARRLKNEDKELLDIFENIYGVSRETAKGLTDPKELVTYFSREIEKGMKEMGYSIDWRRKFYTYDEHFNKFIEWQFQKLKERGYISIGEHPVPWCPECNNAIGAHDTKGDVDPELGEYVFVKFSFGERRLLTATFRPETLYGVTNLWVNPDARYVEIEVENGEKYVVAKDAAEYLGMQIKFEVRGDVSADELLKAEFENPLTGDKVPALPASFVDPANGSGAVMSVPAHAPYDYQALKDIGKVDELGLKQVLEIEEFGEFPAKEISERMKIASQEDVNLEKATKEIYKKEAHAGKMVAGKYRGKLVMQAKELIKKDLLDEGNAIALHEIINGPVYCRCGARAAVKMVKDQWFIDYGNEEWKNDAKKCLEMMEIVPEKMINEYLYTVDWLKRKACTRSSGLGTKFPFDQSKMIEALSDSTIYMAFYTISHKLKEMDAEKLTPEFFDYVFLGRGEGNEEMEELRKEFLYWYPLDSRHSATDLVHNHLTFFIFNHAAVFPEEHWPRKIVTNGFVLMEGGKMSKSMGNILPLRDAIREFGADVVRFSVVSGAELSADSDFNKTIADGFLNRIKFMRGLAEKAGKESGSEELSMVDKWLLSKLHRRVKQSKEQYEKLQLREISQAFFYNTVNDLKWYLKRTGEPKLREYVENWSAIMSPFIPHTMEEFWEMLGEKKFVENAEMACLVKFPEADEGKIDEEAEKAEELVIATREDIDNILGIIKKENPEKISIYVADEWKRKVLGIVAEEKKFDTSMKKAMQEGEIKKKGKECSKVIQQLMKNVNSLSKDILSSEEEYKALSEAAEFLGKEFGCEVNVAHEKDAPQEHAQKAKNAMPEKASIFVE